MYLKVVLVAVAAVVVLALAPAPVAASEASAAGPLGGCIPNCVCVTAEGCPCCASGWLIPIFPGHEDSRLLLTEIRKIADMAPYAVKRARERSRKEDQPSTRAAQARYFSSLALLHLPPKQSAILGITVDPTDPAAGGIDVPFEYLAYAACWYGGVAGGGDVVDVGDECKSDWID